MLLALSLVLAACQGRAAPNPPAPPDPAGPTLTYAESGLPWNVPNAYLTDKNVWAICNSQLIFVGTIVEAESFRVGARASDFPEVSPNMILTEATFDVERRVVGDPGQRFVEIMTGGEVYDGRLVGSHSPYPGKGLRYALGLSKVKQDPQYPTFDSWKSWGIDAWIAIDPKAPLPSESRLRLERDRVCGL